MPYRTPTWTGVKRIQVLLAEAVGTYFIVLTYALSGMDPVATGLAVLGQTYALRHVSLAQFNPAVSLALAITQSITVLDALMCVVVQILAALMAGFSVFSISEHVNVPVPATDDFAGNVSAATLELLFTFAVVLVALNALRDTPNSYFGMAVGLTVLAGMTSAVTISGGAFNPALALGLQVAATMGPGSCNMKSQLIYWLASLVGGALAALAFMFMHKGSRLRSRSGDATDTLEDPPPSVVAVFMVECIGTFFLTLTASLSNQPLAVGCILTAMVYMASHVSGGDFNPAVTLGIAIRFRAPVKDYLRLLLKALSQIAGALLAGFVTYGVASHITYPNPDGPHGAFAAFVFEAVYSTAWVLVVLCVATPTSEIDADDGTDEEAPQSFYGLAIGLTVAAGVYSASRTGGASGGVFNPAMGTGLCVTDAITGGPSGKFLWIYWAAPMLAALVAPLLFTLTHSRQERFGYRPV